MSLFRQAFLHIRELPSAFWVVIFATLMNQIGNMAIVFLVLYLNQHLGLTLAQASSGFATFSAGMLLTGLLGGSLVDKVGAARMMTAALFTNGLILLSFPLIQGYLAILFICLMWGCTYGLYRPASQTLVSHLSSPGIHKITFSVYRLVLNLGMSIGPALGGFLAAHSYQAIFIGNGLANLLAAAILMMGLGRSAWFHYRPALQDKWELSIKWLKRDPALLLFLLGMIPVSMIFFQHESTLAVFLKRDLQFSLTFYGILFTINTLIIVFCELPLNVMTMHWPYRLNFMLGSLLISVGFAGFYLATFAWHIILLTIVWTVGEMILYPSASSYIADIAPKEHRGSYMSLSNTGSNVGMLLGPWSGAILMENLGAGGLWLSCGAFGILSLLLFYYLREPNKT